MSILPSNLRADLGNKRRALLLQCAALLGSAFLPAAPLRAQTAFDLPQLTQLLSQARSGDATFKEKRTVDMLERTLESSGRLSFAAPDTFVRETLKPRQEKIAVVGNSVTMSMGSRSRTVPLDSVPEAAVIMEAIRGTLTGNRALLERHFTAAVSGNAQRWMLELVPVEPRLRELVKSVQLGGQQSVVREVTVNMADGDRSVMTIEPMAAPPKPASAAS
ncbi:MAG: outer membrane lipoprotein carrier protein LolA [Cytophagales bacterium]|nr:outer membrane lipoprotein carrier protein LolA [Rhizobacter sp.]